MIVRYTPTALRHLDEIWDHNVEAYGVDHADRYVAHLRTNTDRLNTVHASGRPIPAHPEYRYRTVRRSRKGHGHLVVYTVVAGTIEVLAFYHTAQDWQGRIAQGEI